MAKVAKYITDPAEFKRQYDRVVQLRKELEARKKELEDLISLLESNKSLPDDVQTNLTALKAEADSLAALLASAKTYTQSIEAYYTSWSATKQKIDDEYKLAQDNNAEIEKLVTKTTGLEAKLTTEAQRATDLLDDARKTLDIVTDGSLSTVFKKRSEERQKARRWWTIAVFVAVVAFIGAVWYALSGLKVDGAGEIGIWFLRLILVTPFGYLLFFVTSQYNRERDLEERYAFKSLVAQTLQNNTKLLRDEFVKITEDPDATIVNKVMDFTIESMKGVYKEPYKNINVVSKFKWNPRNSQLEAEAQTVESDK